MIIAQLKHASKIFRKQGCPRLADDCISLFTDHRNLDVVEATRLIHLALGGTIYA